jgi:hypothetical protein
MMMTKLFVLMMCAGMAMSGWATSPQLPTPVGGFYKIELPVNTYYESVIGSVDPDKIDRQSLQVFLDHLVNNYKEAALLKLNPEWDIKPKNPTLSLFGISSIQCIKKANCYFIYYADLIWIVTTTKDHYLIDYALISGSRYQSGRGTVEQVETVADRSSAGAVYFCNYYAFKKYEGSKYIGDFGSSYIGKIHNDGHIEVRPYTPPDSGDCLYKDIEK